MQAGAHEVAKRAPVRRVGRDRQSCEAVRGDDERDSAREPEVVVVVRDEHAAKIKGSARTSKP
jgi:hypothetical protein